MRAASTLGCVAFAGPGLAVHAETASANRVTVLLRYAENIKNIRLTSLHSSFPHLFALNLESYVETAASNATPSPAPTLRARSIIAGLRSEATIFASGSARDLTGDHARPGGDFEDGRRLQADETRREFARVWCEEQRSEVRIVQLEDRPGEGDIGIVHRDLTSAGAATRNRAMLNDSAISLCGSTALSMPRECDDGRDGRTHVHAFQTADGEKRRARILRRDAPQQRDRRDERDDHQAVCHDGEGTIGARTEPRAYDRIHASTADDADERCDDDGRPRKRIEGIGNVRQRTNQRTKCAVGDERRQRRDCRAGREARRLIVSPLR